MAQNNLNLTGKSGAPIGLPPVICSGACSVRHSEMIRSTAESLEQALMSLAKDKGVPVVEILEPKIERGSDGNMHKVLRPVYELDPDFVIIREESWSDNTIRFRWKRKSIPCLPLR
jgi:hypothetical protein